jgi:hypothetical protein
MSSLSFPIPLSENALMRLLSCCVGCMVIGVSALFGQGGTLVGAGYADPAITVAPGQITTIFVAGLSPDFTKPSTADGLPLPTSLAGTSASINQTSLKQSFPVPLLAIRQANTCSPSVAQSFANRQAPPECFLTAITLQIPSEISVTGDFSSTSTDLTITVNGTSSRAFSLSPFVDNIHVLKTCDRYPPKNGYISGCNSVVNHADGTPVTADSPARPNETIVIYSYGLGQTSPVVNSGEATPTPAPVLGPVFVNPVAYAPRTVAIEFDFRPNASPSRPYFFLSPLDANPVPAPQFVGLTPGQVGLYQINVKLPDSFPELQPCTTAIACTGLCPALMPITSNLTIDIDGVSSFDGAAICVEPPK